MLSQRRRKTVQGCHHEKQCAGTLGASPGAKFTEVEAMMSLTAK